MQGPSAYNIFTSVIVEGPTGGVFVYDAAGNLRTAIVGQTTTDPNQGITCYAGVNTFNGHGAIISLFSSTLDAQFWYADLGSSARGALVTSISPQALGGTDPFGSAFLAGTVSYELVSGGTFAAIQQNAERIAWFTAATAAGPYNIQSAITQDPLGPPANQLTIGAGLNPLLVTVGAGGGTPHTNAQLEVQGTISGQSPGALTAFMPITQTDATTFTVTAATATQASKAWSIPGSDASAGTWYRLTVNGAGTEGSTAQTLQIGLALNGTAIKSSTMPAVTASLAFRFRFVCDIHIKTTGAGGTMEVTGHGIYGGGSPAVNAEGVLGSTTAGGEAINTTVANTLSLVLNWAAVTGAPTITTFNSMLERFGP